MSEKLNDGTDGKAWETLGVALVLVYPVIVLDEWN